MKKIAAVLVLMLSLVLSSCESTSSYREGYKDGYSDGFEQGREAASLKEQVEAPGEPTVDEKKAEDPPTEKEQEPPALQAKPEPRDGYLFETIPYFEGVAPLELETPAGKGGYYVVCNPSSLTASSDFLGEYYLAKAKRENGGYGSLKFYVSAGSVVEVDVPLGWFSIYYATGDTWYGEEYLFGDGTKYYKLDDSFRFWLDSEGTYHGWTVQLEEVSGGNLDFEEISEDDFPQ